MLKEIILKFSSSCYAKFNFISVLSDEKSLKTSTELFLPQELNSAICPSEERLIYIEEWRRLCDYLEKHIADQQVSYPEESYVFTTYELIFSIQALTGRVKSDTEGNFSIRFMVNIGLDPDARNRIFAGIQTVVQVAEVRKFVSELRNFLAEVESIGNLD